VLLIAPPVPTPYPETTMTDLTLDALAAVSGGNCYPAATLSFYGLTIGIYFGSCQMN
jgi:hypothetical protein